MWKTLWRMCKTFENSHFISAISLPFISKIMDIPSKNGWSERTKGVLPLQNDEFYPWSSRCKMALAALTPDAPA